MALTHREVKEPGERYTARKWQRHNLKPNGLAPESILPTSMCLRVGPVLSFLSPLLSILVIKPLYKGGLAESTGISCSLIDSLSAFFLGSTHYES